MGTLRSDLSRKEKMVKKKADVCLDVGSKIARADLGGGSAEVPVRLVKTVVAVRPTVEGSPQGVSANEVTADTADVAYRKILGSNRFWLLLEQAGYEAWYAEQSLLVTTRVKGRLVDW